MKKNKGQWIGLAALALVVILTLLRGQPGSSIPVSDSGVTQDIMSEDAVQTSESDDSVAQDKTRDIPQAEEIAQKSLSEEDSDSGQKLVAADETAEQDIGAAEDGLSADEVQTIESDSGVAQDKTRDIPQTEEVDPERLPETEPGGVTEDGTYTSKEEVAAYIHQFGHLPSNYISKNAARDLGWDAAKGNLWKVAPGMSIGGDRFGNREGILPDAKGRKYTECDIDYSGGKRNGRRIVFSNDGLVFYTDDHYETFEQLY